MEEGGFYLAGNSRTAYRHVPAVFPLGLCTEDRTMVSGTGIPDQDPSRIFYVCADNPEYLKRGKDRNPCDDGRGVKRRIEKGSVMRLQKGKQRL